MPAVGSPQNRQRQRRDGNSQRFTNQLFQGKCSCRHTSVCMDPRGANTRGSAVRRSGWLPIVFNVTTTAQERSHDMSVLYFTVRYILANDSRHTSKRMLFLCSHKRFPFFSFVAETFSAKSVHLGQATIFIASISAKQQLKVDTVIHFHVHMRRCMLSYNTHTHTHRCTHTSVCTLACTHTHTHTDTHCHDLLHSESFHFHRQSFNQLLISQITSTCPHINSLADIHMHSARLYLS